MENPINKKKDEPLPQRETPVENKEVKKAPAKPSLKTVRCKMEAAEKLALTDIPTSSFLKSARVFEDNSGKLIIKLSNDFALTMLTRQASKDAIKAAFSACLMREISDAMLVSEKDDGKENEEYDVLDDLTND